MFFHLLLLVLALLFFLLTVLLCLAPLLGLQLVFLFLVLDLVQVSGSDCKLEGLHGLLEGGGRLAHFLLPALDEAVPQFGGLFKVGRRCVHGPGELKHGVDLLLGELRGAVLALGKILLCGGVLEHLAQAVKETLSLKDVRDLPHLE